MELAGAGREPVTVVGGGGGSASCAQTLPGRVGPRIRVALGAPDVDPEPGFPCCRPPLLDGQRQGGGRTVAAWGGQRYISTNIRVVQVASVHPRHQL